MFGMVLKRLSYHYNKIQFSIFASILKKYKVKFFFEDKLGILTKREFDDNYEFLFSTGYSCDSMPMMIALNDRIKGTKIAVDVGANIGITGIWMAKNCAHVYAFEPVETNIRRMKENFVANHISNIEIIANALSNHNGEAELKIYDSFGHHSFLDSHVSEKKGTQKVQTVRLDDFCNSNSL